MGHHWDIKPILTTLFMVYAVCYTVTRRHLNLSTPLGTARTFAFFVTAFGLCTFFAPLASANPAVLGRTVWSGLDILKHVYDGTLRLSPVAFDVLSTYLLMLFYCCSAPSSSKKAIVGSERPRHHLQFLGLRNGSRYAFRLVQQPRKHAQDRELWSCDVCNRNSDVSFSPRFSERG